MQVAYILLLLLMFVLQLTWSLLSGWKMVKLRERRYFVEFFFFISFNAVNIFQNSMTK